jgi:hypothetical protein
VAPARAKGLEFFAVAIALISDSAFPPAADGAVHIQDDCLQRLAPMHRVNPCAGQIDEGGEVIIRR